LGVSVQQQQYNPTGAGQPPPLPVGQQITPPMYPLSAGVRVGNQFGVPVQPISAPSVAKFNATDDYFDYVPNFDASASGFSSSSAAGGNAGGPSRMQTVADYGQMLFDDSVSGATIEHHPDLDTDGEQVPFFVDVDEPSTATDPIIYAQL